MNVLLFCHTNNAEKSLAYRKLACKSKGPIDSALSLLDQDWSYLYTWLMEMSDFEQCSGKRVTWFAQLLSISDCSVPLFNQTGLNI